MVIVRGIARSFGDRITPRQTRPGFFYGAKPMAKAKPKRRLTNVKVEEISLVDSPAVPESQFLVAKRDEEAAEAKEYDVEEKPVAEETAEAAVGIAVETVAEEIAKVEEAVVEVAKASDAWVKAVEILRGTATDMDPSGLEMLANVMRYTMYRYGEDESVREKLAKMGVEPGEYDEDADDIEKALKVIGPTNFSKIDSAAETIITAAQSIRDVAKAAKEIKKAEDGGEAAEVTKECEPVATEPQEAVLEAPVVREVESRPLDMMSAAESIYKERIARVETERAAQVVAGLSRIADRLDQVEQRQAAFSEGLKLARGKV